MRIKDEVSRVAPGVYVAVLTGGLVGVTAAAYVRFVSQMQAYRGALALANGDDLGVSTMAHGMFGSIAGAMLVGTAVWIAVAIACWLTMDLRTGLAMAVLALVPIAAFNFAVAAFLRANVALLAQVPRTTATNMGQAVSSVGDVLVTAAIGMVIGYFAGKRRYERRLKEHNRFIFPGRAERAQAEAQFAARTETRGAATEQPVPQVQPQVATAPTERRAVVCRACGAQNAPLRSVCLRCGAGIEA